MNSNSEKVLIEKFKREFNEALAEIEFQDSSKFNYNQLLDLYKVLYFIKEESEEQDRCRALQV